LPLGCPGRFGRALESVSVGGQTGWERGLWAWFVGISWLVCSGVVDA
jgi:hypothetical protein